MSDQQQIMVTLKHVYAVNGCSMGALVFLKRHKLDYRRFFTGGGLPVEQIEATGDAMAIRVAEVARNE